MVDSYTANLTELGVFGSETKLLKEELVDLQLKVPIPDQFFNPGISGLLEVIFRVPWIQLYSIFSDNMRFVGGLNLQ